MRLLMAVTAASTRKAAVQGMGLLLLRLGWHHNSSYVQLSCADNVVTCCVLHASSVQVVTCSTCSCAVYCSSKCMQQDAAVHAAMCEKLWRAGQVSRVKRV